MILVDSTKYETEIKFKIESKFSNDDSYYGLVHYTESFITLTIASCPDCDTSLLYIL